MATGQRSETARDLGRARGGAVPQLVLRGSLFLCVLVAAPALPATPEPKEMVYFYNGRESPEDHRYDYHWQVLRAALERTRPKYGPYRMEPADYMNEDRQAFELKNRTGKLSVLIRGDSLEYADQFEPVWIPIDKGLLGYRVFLIRREDQPHFTRATRLEDLRRYTIGQGSGWKDIDILQANGLQVMAGGDYAGLFAMLANKRFDLFSRGVEEVMDEYSRQKGQFQDLAIEKNLLLYYPIARYFWFSNSEEGRRLAQRVREGMTLMIEDGTLDRMFEKSHARLFKALGLHKRKLFKLKNPFMAPQVPLADNRLWFSPWGAKEPNPSKAH